VIVATLSQPRTTLVSKVMAILVATFDPPRTTLGLYSDGQFLLQPFDLHLQRSCKVSKKFKH
jgi:hypothetical protein